MSACVCKCICMYVYIYIRCTKGNTQTYTQHNIITSDKKKVISMIDHQMCVSHRKTAELNLTVFYTFFNVHNTETYCNQLKGFYHSIFAIFIVKIMIVFFTV